VKLLTEKGVGAWNEWRSANRQIRPDLEAVNLNNAKLKQANFRDASLRHANLTGADLTGAHLSWADLSGADLNAACFYHATLINADLRGTNLRHANLRGADFNGASLSTCDLTEADLSGANLDRADLSRAILTKANITSVFLENASLNSAKLSQANLSSSNLNGADFTGSDLMDTDFSYCTMGKTQLGNLDLRCTKGLETVRHVTPSTIGLDTIYRSNGKIPQIFLRGAGIAEVFIAYMESLVANASPMRFYSCFISYSHADKAFAKRLYDVLQKKGIRCWLDEHQLLPGDDFYQELDRAIRLWDKMLLCCSENSLQSWWVDHEIGMAFEKEQQLMAGRGLIKERRELMNASRLQKDNVKVHVLVPLNLDNFLFSDKWQSGYQAQVRRRLAADFTDSTDTTKFDLQVERLIRALRADEGARERPPTQKL